MGLNLAHRTVNSGQTLRGQGVATKQHRHHNIGVGIAEIRSDFLTGGRDGAVFGEKRRVGRLWGQSSEPGAKADGHQQQNQECYSGLNGYQPTQGIKDS